MGDILHALPAVTALRQAHPRWVIDWVVERRWRELLSAGSGSGARDPLAQPLVDHIHYTATKEWRKAPFSLRTLREIQSLRRGLKAGRYDVVIDFQGALRSAVVGSFACARRHIGEERPRELAAAWFFTDHVATKGAHVIEQDVEIACAIAGDLLSPVQPLLPTDPGAEAWADDFLPLDGTPAVLINPGAGWGAKRWPVERYAEVARSLIDDGFRILVNAGPGEEPLAEAIRQGVGEASAAVTTLNCNLAHLIAAVRRAALVIAGDTGPLHLACALGRPVVGIYGPTDPSRNGPFGATSRVLRSPESRRDHTRYSAPEAGLLTIQAADVLRAAGELLYARSANLSAEESARQNANQSAARGSEIRK
jgi:heptosyltransferase-1